MTEDPEWHAAWLADVAKRAARLEACLWMQDNPRVRGPFASMPKLLEREAENGNNGNSPIRQVAKAHPVNNNVAVVGGGVAGMACALRLAQRGYKVRSMNRRPCSAATPRPRKAAAHITMSIRTCIRNGMRTSGTL